MPLFRRLMFVTLFGLLPAGKGFAQLKDARVADYEQWRLAQKSGAVADPAAIAVLPGFKIELVRVASRFSRRDLLESIVARKSSPVSIMPEGLLNTLDKKEILDLLSYLESVATP